MQYVHRKYIVSVVGLAALLTVAGCHKKKPAPPPPPPPTATAPAPTADIQVTPTSINPGDSAVLTWKTTNATDVSIEGVGQVATAGTMNVKPTDSTNYHLIARGDGGSADATARLTVNAPQAAPSNLNENDMDDALFHQNVQDIFYDYDSADIRSDAQSTLSKDAAYLNSHPDVRFIIGGYCDERGSNEYNLGLGQNRAEAAKNALVNAGVSASRIRVISYGKEKPFCTQSSEDCWQQNRRAGFALDK